MGTFSKTRQPCNYRPAGKKCGWAGTTWKKGAVMPVEACRRALGRLPAQRLAVWRPHTHWLWRQTGMMGKSHAECWPWAKG